VLLAFRGDFPRLRSLEATRKTLLLAFCLSVSPAHTAPPDPLAFALLVSCANGPNSDGRNRKILFERIKIYTQLFSYCHVLFAACQRYSGAKAMTMAKKDCGIVHKVNHKLVFNIRNFIFENYESYITYPCNVYWL